MYVCPFASLTLAGPLALVAITEFAGFVGAGGCTGWDDSAVEASLGDNVDLDGRVATRVVDGTGVDLGDTHVGCFCERTVMLVELVQGSRSR